jgi:drug/metabolite transporter (DMT)-like permease
MGEFFALATAVAWACAVIFFKKSGETVSPFTLNFYRVGISSLLLLATLAVAGGPFARQAPLTDYVILALSGVIAIAVSDTLFHKSLNLVGAGISAIVDCLYSPFIILFAFLMIRERLGSWQYAGMVLVVAGVLVAAWHRPPPGVTRTRLVAGVLWGAAAMATLAFGIVLAKPVLNDSPVLWATTVRQVASLVAMLPFALHRSRRREVLDAFRPAKAWKYSLPGTVLGSYLALILWIAGMKYTQAGAAAILNQTSTILVLLLASLFLREPFTGRKVLAAVLAVAGILMVTLG